MSNFGTRGETATVEQKCSHVKNFLKHTYMSASCKQFHPELWPLILYGYKLQVTYCGRMFRYALLQAREEAAVGATAGLEEGVLRCRRQLHVISC